MTLASPRIHAQQFLEFISSPGTIRELRVFFALEPQEPPKPPKKPIWAGHFTDASLMAANAAALTSDKHRAVAVYYSLNSVIPERSDILFGKKNKTLTNAHTTVRGPDIAARELYLIDCDPHRPKDCSATDAEKARATLLVQEVKDYLHDQGWPEPIVLDSGNGGALLYRGPGTDINDTQNVWRNALLHLSEKFTGFEGASVDKAVFDPSRISRMPGTWNRKGDNTPQRPHRIAQVISYPEKWEAVQKSLLTALADRVIGGPHTAPSSASSGVGQRVSSKLIERIVQSVKDDIVAEYPETFGEVYKETNREDGVYLGLTICPHTGEAHHDQFVGYGHSCLIVSTLPNTPEEPNRLGSIGFHCLSDRCPSGRVELMKLIEEQYGDCHWWLSYCEEILPTVDEVVPYIQYKRKSPGGYDLYARVSTMDLTWEDVEATFREHAVIADGHLARCKPDGQVEFRAWANRVVTCQDVDAAASLLGQGWINLIAFPAEKRPLTDAELADLIREVEHPRETVWVP